MTEDNIPETALEAIRYFGDPVNCHNFLVGLRWGDKVRCPHCDSGQVGKFSGKRMVSNCKNCKKLIKNSEFCDKVCEAHYKRELIK